MISHYVIHIGAMAFATFAIALSDDIVSFPLKTSHGQQIQGGLQGTRRRLQMQEPPSSFPVYQEYGAYYVEIYVGSPPQKQTVLVDSGSENTGIPCADCVDCGERHVDPNFKQSVSGSFRQLKCSDCQKGRCEEKYDTCAIQSFYAEKSSWQGNEVEDDVYLGMFKGERDSKKFRPKFTCMESNEGEFKDQLSNGIMGMNLDKFSFWRQMHEQGIMKKKKFSLCLNTHPLSKHVIGSLTMGGVDERLGHRDSDMEFFDFTDSNGLFEVEMRKVYIHSSKGNSEAFDGAIDLIRNDTLAVEVNDRSLNYGGVKLDSGTTGTLLAPIIRKPFMEAWEKVTGKAFPTEPINISPKELEKWPTIIIQMKGSSKVSNASGRQKPVFDENNPNDVLVTLPPSHYMYFNLGSRKYNPIIKFDGSHGRGSILGSNFMRTHNVLFDMEDETIGMIKSDCNIKDLPTENQKSRHIMVPDPYASYDQILELYYEDMCREKKFLFCSKMYVEKYPYISFLIFGIVTLILALLLLKTSDEYDDYLDNDQLSKPLLQKSA